MAIYSLYELSETITKVANRALEIAIENTSYGSWRITHDDVADLISEEDYLNYFDFIAGEIAGREECLDLDEADHELNINLGLAWCKNIQLVEGEDLEFGYREFRPAPSMAHLAEIGEKAVNHIVQAHNRSKLQVGDFGITTEDVSFARFMVNPATFLAKEEDFLRNIPVPQKKISNMDYEELLFRSAEASTEGRRPLIEWCVNSFGQNIASEIVNKEHAGEIKKLEHIFNEEKPSVQADHAGALIHGKPAIVISRVFGDETLRRHGLDDRNILHAQVKMMASQLSEALSSYNTNISAAIDTVYTGTDQVSSEIVAILDADTAQAYRVSFERSLDHLLNHMPLSLDISWVKEQYETALQYIRTGLKAITRDHQFIEENAERIAIETCGFLGKRLGQLQYDWDNAIGNHDEPALTMLADKCNLAKNTDDLEDLTDAARITVKLDEQQYVRLYTKPFEQHVLSNDGFFVISKGELKKVLQEHGYDKDFPLHTFVSSYSFDLAKEFKQALDQKNERKPALKSQIQDAEKRNAKQASSTHKDTHKMNPPGHEPDRK